MKKKAIIFMLCFAIAIFYTLFISYIHQNLLIPSSTNYYVYLLDAFFHGRLDLHPSWETLDLSLYHNKWYLYWGPAPLLIILPFYLISHLQTSDTLFNIFGGITNVLLFYFTIEQFQKYFKIKLSLIAEIFLLLSFALISPNFSLSLSGGIALSSQIFAITYLLLFYLFYFLFLNKEKHALFILATIFFSLTVLSRYSLVFNGILYLYLFIHYHLSNRKMPSKFFWSFSSVALAFAIPLGIYNYLRFGNFLELGHRYHQSAARYREIVRQYKVFSISYFWNNFYYYFINIVHFTPTTRPVIVDNEGNSVLSMYPTLWLLPLLFYKRKDLNKQKLYFTEIAGIVVLITITFYLCYFATGWIQFGIRYFMDVIPLLFLLLIFILKYVPKSIQVIILTFGIFINIYGALAFFGK